MTLTGGEVRFEREHDGQVAALTISRPDKMNAITWEMRGRMLERFAEIDSDPEIRVVVIRGEGENFSPGGDIPGFMEVEPHEFIDLGHNLSLKVVGEGVETDDVYATLREAGCDLAQGFLLARPMPADQLRAWLANIPEPASNAV